MPFDINNVIKDEMSGENELKRGVYGSMSGKFAAQEVDAKIAVLSNLNKEAESFLSGAELAAFKTKASKKFTALLDEI